MKLNPHLALDGRCKEAFEFYERCLGGKIVAMISYADMPNAQDLPADMRGRIMHARIVLGEVLPAFADKPKWAQMMRSSVRMAQQFSALRMVDQYFREVYVPERAEKKATA